MKSISSIACLTCCLAPHGHAVNSFAFTTGSPRIPDPRTIQSTPTASSPHRSPVSTIGTNRHCRSSPTSTTTTTSSSSSSLPMAHGDYDRRGGGRSSPRYASASDRTKRQERVGHVVRSELATVLARDSLRNDDEPIESDLRRRINVVHVDVSPDLRQARITVSIMGGKDRRDDAAAKRRAYAWLVRNTRSVRFALAKRMKHMKGGSPDLTFVQVDVGAAVDVMQLIEKVSEGYKREDVGLEFEGEWEEEGEEDGDDGWFDFDEDGDGISVEVEV